MRNEEWFHQINQIEGLLGGAGDHGGEKCYLDSEMGSLEIMELKTAAI